MNKKDQRQLLSKLKEIGKLDKRQRFSQKVFRGFRSMNQSQESSFHRDQLFTTEDATPQTPVYIATPETHLIRQEVFQQIEEKRDKILKKGETSKSTRLKKYLKTGKTQMSPSQSQYFSKRNDFSERKLFFASNMNSTRLDYSNGDEQKNQQRCEECRKQKNAKDLKIQQQDKQIRILKGKIKTYEEKLCKLKKGIEPYIKNVELMSVIVDSISQYEPKEFLSNVEEKVDFDVEIEREQLRQTTKVNQWLLKEGVQKQKKHHHQTYRLKGELDSLAGQNIQLKNKLKQRETRIKILEEEIKGNDGNNSLKERLEMCTQERDTFMIRYKQKSQESLSLTTKVEELRYRVTVLTSLIGCAVIFDVHQKEKDELYLRQILNQIDSFQNVTHRKMDDNVFQYLKILKTDENGDKKKSSQKKITKDSLLARNDKKNADNDSIYHGKNIRKLYYPNYLILLGEEAISARLESSVIKPILFIKIRSILDSKYIDYRLFQTSSSKFPEFCNSFLKSYDIQSSQKKLYYISRFISENQLKEINVDFIKYLMDERINDIPQVEIFRDSLMGKYEEDEIYFYLMCRHKFLQGNELQNFINSGDPSKLIRFDKAKRIAILITQNFGRSIQNFICYHLNERKIKKAKIQFVKVYYILKLLVLVYRKIRAKKIWELKDLFDNVTTQVNQKGKISFSQFYQLIRKNFSFLKRTDIISMYQLTIATVQSQKYKIQFYQCFASVCGPRLFLLQLMKFDMKLGFECEEEEKAVNILKENLHQSEAKPTRKEAKNNTLKNTSSLNSSQTFFQTKIIKQTVEPNPLNQIWPDSIYSLGNQTLNQQYVHLLNQNPKRLRTKFDFFNFLLKTTLGHIIKQDIHLQYREELVYFLNSGIRSLIEYLNKLENCKIQLENERNLASRKLGKFFKNKIYEFYHEMLDDINRVRAEDINKSKRNFKDETDIFEVLKKNIQ